ncbi:MAG TPA: glycerol-3-phosphate 1-O-acyltransferase PlsY [Gemmatimonadaceae bacterium]|nr:glycerol-3-phosphate 1-O-acyltransferase PlsY [Gemmatimonadaceae bacterium]
MRYAIAIVLAYVVGSFPSAYLAGRVFRGVDLRKVGSGNLGATNVYREIGLAAALVVLALDALKGWIAVTRVPVWCGLPPNDWWTVAMGVAAVAGHAKPVFLLWQGGGKGVATATGVFIALSPAALGIAAAGFALTVAITRYVSLGSIVGAVVLPVAVAMKRGMQSPVFVVSVLLSVFVVWRHRSNMRRVATGIEPRLGRPGASRQ